MSKFSGRKLELSTNFTKKARERGSGNWSNKWEKLRLKILERDDYTCRYCGYRAEKYQICHHIDEDPENNELENLVIICIDCNFILHSYYATHVDRLEIFYSPKYSQVEIITKTRSLRIDGHSDEEIIKLLDLKPVNVDEFRKEQNRMVEHSQRPLDDIKSWKAKIESYREIIEFKKEQIEMCQLNLKSSKFSKLWKEEIEVHKSIIELRKENIKRVERIERIKEEIWSNPEKLVGFVRHWKYDTRYKNYVKGKSKSKDNKLQSRL